MSFDHIEFFLQKGQNKKQTEQGVPIVAQWLMNITIDGHIIITQHPYLP